MVDELIHDSVKWEYFILQVNLDNNPASNTTSPEVASQKLQGSLSPDFIKEQFPDQYTENKPVHPVNQLQTILNKLGEQTFFKKNEVFIPEPLVIQKNQRPVGPFGGE